LTLKLIALDVDGTLVDKDLVLIPRLRAAIASAQQRGARIVISTGRMYKSTVPFARGLNLPAVPLIVYNGALVREYPSGRTIYHEPLPVELCREIARFCEAHGYHLNAYVDDELYVNEPGPKTEAYMNLAQVEAHVVQPMSAWIDRPSTKMLMIDEPERMPAIQAQLQTLLGDQATIVQSNPRFLEIVRPGVSKGKALEAVAESMGIGRADVIAMGDAGNDIPMLQWAGTSFTFAHAGDEVKRAATYVIDKGPGEGVAEALKMLGLFAD